jgi:2-dehydro-3-deoxyphosphogluconate aldolase/(4S)-4-hydroxy-2-oxoglutarate aldolase
VELGDRPAHDRALGRIAGARVVPVVRSADARTAARLVDRMLEAGLRVVELTTTTPGWAALTARLRASDPELCVGVGTITHPELAAEAVAAGAGFCVTPHPVAGVRRRVEAAGVPLLEGGFTPAEVLAAADRGVAKLFPAHLGGVRYLRTLLGVAPAARIMPTGGVRLGEVSQWLSAGAFAVGVGSDLADGDVAARLSEALGE